MGIWLFGIKIPLSVTSTDTCASHRVFFGRLETPVDSSRNVDHFFFIDVEELEASSKLVASGASPRNNLSSSADAFFGPELKHGPHLPASSRYNAFGRGANSDLGDALREDFREMPGPNNLALKDYTVVNVHTSVIPTYFPGLRIYS